MFRLLYATSTTMDGNLSVRLEGERVVAPRRDAFLSMHGVRAEDCVFIETEHLDAVTRVSEADKGKSIATEALITNTPGVILYLLTADCLPITFHDPVQGAIGLAHLGWRPTDMRLVQKVARDLIEAYHSKPEDIRVYMGPGIKVSSYVVPEARQEHKEEWGAFLESLPSGEMRVDLGGYNHAQLLEVGILPEHIEISAIDTALDSNYFSHYRSVRTGESEGRFATILGLQN